MRFDAYTLPYYVLFVALMMVIIKIYRKMPSNEIIKEIKKQYPRSTIAKSIFAPFFESWKKDVEPGHIEVIERYAKSGRAFIVAWLVYGTLSLIIRYLQFAYVSSAVERLSFGE